MKEEANQTGFYVIIGLAVLGGIGYLYYRSNLKDKVDNVVNKGKFLGIF